MQKMLLAALLALTPAVSAVSQGMPVIHLSVEDRAGLIAEELPDDNAICDFARDAAGEMSSNRDRFGPMHLVVRNADDRIMCVIALSRGL